MACMKAMPSAKEPINRASWNMPSVAGDWLSMRGASGLPQRSSLSTTGDSSLGSERKEEAA
eukprot:CAMPEP_0181431884 /NCGR_PEP_ID=MMETSP1110-20121109/18483_1 /TAXON_ID=174948 /ORGANISM="Symbiodinium sp., Strain CCMP421" /LENGTH=60 /DNA_ID=CAMNT_0023555273 /DNA_START=443 /DNA_END=625 /DNA_ORIENTATION=+